jgi:hypothetical protein
VPEVAAQVEARGRVRPTLARAETGIATRRGALAVFAVALAVFAIESVWLPVLPGRDFYTYLRFYVQMADWHSVYPMSMLFRTPVAPVVIGAPLELLGGWGVEIVMALLFAASVVAWTRVALFFGRRVALLTAVALLLYPSYAILFHQLSSDSICAAAFAAWAYLFSRAVVRPTPVRFALAGVGVVGAALTRPANQILVVFALVPLLLAASWRQRLLNVAACAAVAVLLLAAWAVNNGLRYGDYTVSRGGSAYLPFFRTFVVDHIVSPGNGPASRHFARAVQQDLLTKQPYRGYGVTPTTFFARAKDREFEDAVNLSDRVWGWSSNYAILRKVGIEAVRAHPGAYARGVGHTFFRELWRPLFVALPSRAPASAAPAAPTTAASAGGEVLPKPEDGETIPAARNGFYDTTPHNSIRNVWTSPVDHQRVFANATDAERFGDVETAASRLAGRVPPYRGNRWLTLQFSRSSKLFPPALLWVVAGAFGLVWRRPRRAVLALSLALAALVIIFLNALADYAVIEFGVPLIPALVVFGAAGLLGRSSADPSGG